MELHRRLIEVLAHDALERSGIVVLVEVGTVGAAADHRTTGDPLAATAVDARVIREEEGHVERVAAVVILRVDQGDPFAIDQRALRACCVMAEREA